MAEEITVDSAVLSELDGSITAFKEQHRNSTEDLSRWTALFHFTPDWLWQPRGGHMRLMLHQ